jgi:hypothetical protein
VGEEIQGPGSEPVAHRTEYLKGEVRVSQILHLPLLVRL